MTHIRIPRFLRRKLGLGLALAAIVPGAMLATSAAASASTTVPAAPAAHHDYFRCDETLTFLEDSYYGPRFVFVRDACDVQVYREGGGYGRHHDEDVSYLTDHYGHLRFHFVQGVRDVEVYR